MRLPKSFLLLILIPFIASCATQVSDSISSSSYSSAESDEYISAEKLETNLEDLIYFEFDKASLSTDSKALISNYVKFAKNAKAIRLEGHCDEIFDNALKVESSKILLPLEETISYFNISPDGAKLI